MARRQHGRGRESTLLTVFRIAETGSTNVEMLARAQQGTASEGDWLVADTQTAGRGRQGRIWASPPGNLYATGLIELRPTDPLAPTLALVAGIALYDALAMPNVLIKWPNDILALAPPVGESEGCAKCAGILLDRADNAVVIGFGVNLAHHPDLPDRRTISLAAMGLETPVSTLVDALVYFMAHWVVVWRQGGLAPIRQAWLDRSHRAGTPLSAALPDGRRIYGTFDGLTDDCALRLRLADAGTHVIHAGDVFLI